MCAAIDLTPLTRPAPSRYGSDKPDLRYGLDFHDVSRPLAGCGFRVFAAALEAGGVVKAIRVPQVPPSRVPETSGSQDGVRGLAARLSSRVPQGQAETESGPVFGCY